MPSRQPLPGVLPAVERGDRVRVTIEATVDAVESIPGEDVGRVRATVLTRAKDAPRLIDGAWWVECADVGMVPASRVEVQP